MQTVFYSYSQKSKLIPLYRIKPRKIEVIWNGVEYKEIRIEKNFNPGNYTDRISSAMREKLTKLFEPYNNELYQLLGRNFNWD